MRTLDTSPNKTGPHIKCRELWLSIITILLLDYTDTKRETPLLQPLLKDLPDRRLLEYTDMYCHILNCQRFQLP